jgi:hypothetical protein
MKKKVLICLNALVLLFGGFIEVSECTSRTISIYNLINLSINPLQLNKNTDFNQYVLKADRANNNNGRLDSYGEALAAAVDFLKQNNKYSFRKFADYLKIKGYPMDIQSILNSIQNDKLYDGKIEIKSPPKPDSIESLINLRKSYLPEINRLDSMVRNLGNKIKSKFIETKDLFIQLKEMNKRTTLAEWAQKNIRKCEGGGATDALTYGNDNDNKEYVDYLKFSTIDDSVLTEIFVFLLDCYKIAEFSVMLDAEISKLYYIDNLLDIYGEKFLKYLSEYNYEDMMISGEGIAGTDNRAKTEFDSTVIEFDINSNSDVDKINDIEKVNNELLKLNQSYSLTNEEIDKFNTQINNYNTKLTDLKKNLDILNKWDTKFKGRSDIFADTSRKFIVKNTKSFNPFACYDKWELFRKAYNLKIEGWELLCASYKYNEGLVQMKLEENRLKSAKVNLAVEQQKYYQRFNKLKQRYRELENRK